ncbi:MAG: hypothetical protein CMJ62_16170, partial [Planctomycetaceae bacterium]|nr:hypothetical protein [Planctomycetaceae bacterium]
GIEYRHEQHPGPISLHIVKMELGRKELAVVTNLANGTVFGRQTVSGQAKAVRRKSGQPLVAVNGDYFEMGWSGDARYRGTLEGIHIQNGELVHGPAHASFWVDDQGGPHLTVGEGAQFRVTWPDGSDASFRINCSTTAAKTEVGSSDIVLFTPSFGASTHTKGGLELVLTAVPDSQWLPLRANLSYTGRIRSINRKGDTPIGSETMVLSVVTQVAEELPTLRAGDRVKFVTTISPKFAGVRQAIGGGPPLIQNGKRLVGEGNENNRHPRTVVGFNETELFLVVVDGRQPGLSRGMHYGELADLMDRLGCTNALNMDGGGSSTMWLDGTLVNSPSGRMGQRPVGNALMILGRLVDRSGAN